MKKDLFTRFLDKLEQPTVCWNWKGAILKCGYGQIMGQEKVEYAHRVSYKMFRGEIPDGLQIDHLCRNRRCVNPLHLEAVTPKVNVLRGIGISALNSIKTHCKQGHPFIEKNTIMRSNGRKRDCRACYEIYKASKRVPVLAES